MTGFDLREPFVQGKEPITVMQSLLDWVTRESRSLTPVFVGFNAGFEGFDWSFVNWYFHKFLGQNPFGVAPLDIKAYYMGLTGCSWEETRSSKLPEFLKVDQPERDRHNALADAVYQAEDFSRIKESRKGLSRL